MTDELYQDVNAVWPAVIPPITRIEAARAVAKLWAHFGGGSGFRPRVRPQAVRRCWINRRPSGTEGNGWWRLVHDVSHRVFDQQHRGTKWARGHSWFHSRLELEMSKYVIQQGWLDGKLKPKVKPRAAPDLKAERYQRVVAREKQWRVRAKRATTMLRKLRRQRQYYERSMAA